MTKLSLASLCIEVTRKCNMHCAHCMRGNAQNINLDEIKLETFLSQVTSIGCITFTGGEPTLNVHAIKSALTYCKRFDIPIESFYIVTNGKKITSEFLHTMIEWYAYCNQCNGDIDMCGIALSKDDFHDKIRNENEQLLRALSFYRPDDKRTDFKKHAALINLGRATELSNYQKREHSHMCPDISHYDNDVYVDDTITLTVNGDVLLDCDYAYDETDDIKICDFSNAAEIFRQAATEPNFRFPKGIEE